MSESIPDLYPTLREKTVGRADPAARRGRMREFQSRLVDRMQAARGGSDSRAGQLGVVAGDKRYLIDLPQTGEIATVGTIVAVPLTKAWFLGLTNIRGNLISVIDLAQFLGGAATVMDKQCRIIALSPTFAMNSGLLVASVVGLRNTSDMQAQDGSYIDGDGLPWHALDLEDITRNTQFHDVGI